MKNIFTKIKSKISKKSVCIFLTAFIVLTLLLNLIGYLFNCKYISLYEAVSEGNKYEIRSGLLMKAMDDVGVCDPESAANVWANGLKIRSAAAQYSVMSSELKAKYAAQLENTFPNWVTGMSSPWVESYTICDKRELDKDTYIYYLQFSTATSAGPAGNYKAVLTIANTGKFWQIVALSTDKGLYPYTGFELKNSMVR